MKIAVIADAYALTSELTVKDIMLCKKYNPDALVIRDEDGNDKFALSYNEGKPSVTKFGVTFGGKDKDGKATITEIIPQGTENAKEFIADRFGAIVPYLKELEKSIPTAVKKITDDKQSLMDSIVEA